MIDVVIYTSDPDYIDPDKVQALLESAGYLVLSVTVEV